MLPQPASKEFPAALKQARESRGMSRSELARRANIHQVMPRRYEEPTCREFTKPTANTWLALNRALGFEPNYENSLTPVMDKFLSDASIDEIVAEIRKRGIVVTLTFPVS